MAHERPESYVEVIKGSSNNAPQLRFSSLSDDSSFSSLFDPDVSSLSYRLVESPYDLLSGLVSDRQYSHDVESSANAAPGPGTNNTTRGRYRRAGQSKFKRAWGAATAVARRLKASCRRREERRQENRRIRRENRTGSLGTRHTTRYPRMEAHTPTPHFTAFYPYRSSISLRSESALSFTTIPSSEYSSTTTVNESAYNQPTSSRRRRTHARSQRFRRSIKSALRSCRSTTFINQVLVQFARSGGGLVF